MSLTGKFQEFHLSVGHLFSPVYDNYFDVHCMQVYGGLTLLQ